MDLSPLGTRGQICTGSAPSPSRDLRISRSMGWTTLRAASSWHQWKAGAGSRRRSDPEGRAETLRPAPRVLIRKVPPHQSFSARRALERICSCYSRCSPTSKAC